MTQVEVEAVLHIQRKIRECRIKMQKSLTIEERMDCLHTMKKYKLLMKRFT